jgi:hypothetical protein
VVHGTLGSNLGECFLGYRQGVIPGHVLKRFQKIHFEFQGEGRHIGMFGNLATGACYALRFAGHFVFDSITIDVKVHAEAA